MLTKKQQTKLGPVIVMILDLIQDVHAVIDPQKFRVLSRSIFALLTVSNENP